MYRCSLGRKRDVFRFQCLGGSEVEAVAFRPAMTVEFINSRQRSKVQSRQPKNRSEDKAGDIGADPDEIV